MTRTLLGAALLTCGILGHTSAEADSWLLPAPSTVSSADGQFRFTVTPRELSGQLPYFEDKVAGKANAGGTPEGRPSAQGLLERRSAVGWTDVWNGNLLNDVAPVDVLVAPSGRVVTLDNWHSMGSGEHVLVIYETSGEPRCSLTLQDLFPPQVFETFPRSVSSIRWRGEARLNRNGELLEIPVSAPATWLVEGAGTRQSDATYLLGVRLRDCVVVPPAPAAWKATIEAAAEASARLAADRGDTRARAHAPLLAPTGTDRKEWQGYLIRAWLRIEPLNESGWPRPAWIAIGGPKDPERGGWLGAVAEELAETDSEKPVIVVGGGSSSDVLDALSRAAVAGSAAAGRRVAVVLKDKDFARAREIMAATGVELIQIDPQRPLPQHPTNLRRMQADEEAEVRALADHMRYARDRRAWWLAR